MHRSEAGQRRQRLLPTCGLPWRDRFAVVLLALLVPAAVGCRSAPQREIVERELRLQEDYIYELEDHIDTYAAKLRGCRIQISDLSRQIAELEATQQQASYTDEQPSPQETSQEADAPQQPPTAAEPELPGEAPVISVPDVEVGEPSDVLDLDSPELLEPPDVEMGDEGDLPMSDSDALAPGEVDPIWQQLPIEEPPLLFESSWDARPVNPARADDGPSDVPVEDELAAAADETAGPIAELTIRDVLRHDKQPGEAGQRVTVILASLSEDGRPIPTAGELSLLVRRADPDGQGERLARWDFTPEDVTAAQEESDAEGFELGLLLPDEIPAGEPIELWARLSTADEMKYLASAELAIEELAGAADSPVIVEPTSLASTAPPRSDLSAARVSHEPNWRAASARTKRRYLQTPSRPRRGGWVAMTSRPQQAATSRPAGPRRRRPSEPRVASRYEQLPLGKTADRNPPGWAPLR